MYKIGEIVLLDCAGKENLGYGRIIEKMPYDNHMGTVYCCFSAEHGEEILLHPGRVFKLSEEKEKQKARELRILGKL